MTKKKLFKRTMALVLCTAMVATSVFTGQVKTSQAAGKPKLSATKKTLTVGSKTTLKVKKIPAGSKKVKKKWTSSKKSVATVTSKGVVKARKKGSAKIICTITYQTKKKAKKKVKLTCKVTVKAATSNSENLDTATIAPVTPPTATIVPSTNVTQAPTVTNSTLPEVTETPSATATKAPEATGTPSATATKAPEVTETPSATATKAPEATGTPSATATKVPDATETPSATATKAPEATGRPVPTATKVPEATATPVPTEATPTASPVSWMGTISYSGYNPGEITGDSGNTVTVEKVGGAFELKGVAWTKYTNPMLNITATDASGANSVAYGLTDEIDKSNEYWYKITNAKETGTWNFAQKMIFLMKDWNLTDEQSIYFELKADTYNAKFTITISEAPSLTSDATADADVAQWGTAKEFTAKLGAGINIGNNLEVPVTTTYKEGGNVDLDDLYLPGNSGLSTETAWNADKPITKSYVQALKDTGFTTVRIPVSYVNHTKITTDAQGNKTYKLDTVWMYRVKEVVDYAYDIGMYVIINLHHEGSDNSTDDVLNTYGGEQASWLSPLNSTGDAYTAMEKRFVSTWQQVASVFAGYDEHLIFADMNEFHHGYAAPEEAWCTAQNKLHQAFVDTVRSSNGNNPYRFLIVPGYNTNIDSTAAKLKVPADIEANNTVVGENTVGRIIVEVHYYSPYTYAADDPEDYVWGAGTSSTHHFADEDYLAAQMELMKTTFIDKGIAVIIGEYGAPVHYSSTNVLYAKDEEFRAYFYGSVVKEATSREIALVAWDNGGANSYCFIDRVTDTMRDDADSIVVAILKYTKDPTAAIIKPTE